MTRYGDWNKHNRELTDETDRRGRNPYREKYLQAIRKPSMREIKFRGLRDTESGGVEMVYGQVSMDSNQDCIYYETHPHRIHWRTKSGGHASAPVRKGTVGQYTCLKDKNGKEIYEGDIVKSPNCDNGMVVIYKDIEESDDMTAPGIGFQFNTYPHDMEVIGNIYENPELLPTNQ